jgi:pimeloyl-ACP methyl ester carboxylesterase
LEKIKTPVLLVGGDKPGFDEIYSKMEPCLSNKEKAILPNTTHGLQMENPSEFNKVVLGFIDRH